MSAAGSEGSATSLPATIVIGSGAEAAEVVNLDTVLISGLVGEACIVLVSGLVVSRSSPDFWTGTSPDFWTTPVLISGPGELFFGKRFPSHLR